MASAPRRRVGSSRTRLEHAAQSLATPPSRARPDHRRTTFLAWRTRQSPFSGSTTRRSSSNPIACSCATKGSRSRPSTNADDAVAMVRRRPFSLVLLDEQMPGKRGLDALRELREADPNLSIVMVTKSEEDSTMTEAYRRGARRVSREARDAATSLRGDHASARRRTDPTAGGRSAIRRAVPRSADRSPFAASAGGIGSIASAS